jgi:two-component system LytT family response regulator
LKKKYSAFIVDDERLARADLASMLAVHDNIEVVGEAADVASAAKSITELNPDIIFLDIQMPGETGFDLLEKVPIDAKIVFVTAYDEYAIRAFEVNALDYLLKPVNHERLAHTIERLELDKAVDIENLSQLDYTDSLFLTMNNQLRFLKTDTIIAISSAGDYSEVAATDGSTQLTGKSMKEWEKRLPPKYFVRIHRSTIINLNFIRRTEKWFNYSYRVYMEGIEKPFLISRRYVVKLKNLLG